VNDGLQADLSPVRGGGIVRLGAATSGVLEGSIPLPAGGRWRGFVAIYANGPNAGDSVEVRSLPLPPSL
jgi:hypothetical protein